MPLKTLLQPDEHAALDPTLQALYSRHGGAFELDVDDTDQEGVLAQRRTNRKLLAEVKELKAQLAGKLPRKPREEMTQREALLDDALERLANAPDPEARAAELERIRNELEPILSREVEMARTRQHGDIKAMQDQLRTLLVSSVARKFVAQVAKPGAETVLLPHIEQRLAARLAGEDGATAHAVLVLDALGKPSAATLDHLRDEFTRSAEFAPLIRGTSAEEQAAHARLVAAATSPPSTTP